MVVGSGGFIIVILELSVVGCDMVICRNIPTQTGGWGHTLVVVDKKREVGTNFKEVKLREYKTDSSPRRPLFYTPSHLSELQSFKSIISTHLPFIFIFK